MGEGRAQSPLPRALAPDGTITSRLARRTQHGEELHQESCSLAQPGLQELGRQDSRRVACGWHPPWWLSLGRKARLTQLPDSVFPPVKWAPAQPLGGLPLGGGGSRDGAGAQGCRPLGR